MVTEYNGNIDGLWTPQGSVVTRVVDLGGDTGAKVYHFKVKDPVTGKLFELRVIGDDTHSKAEIEDLPGNAYEKWLLDMREKEHKRKPTVEERKEIGKIIREMKQYWKKRNESSTGKLYFEGAK